MTAYEMRISDWSSDVCSSDLVGVVADKGKRAGALGHVIPGKLRIEVFRECDVRLRVDLAESVAIGNRFVIGKRQAREFHVVLLRDRRRFLPCQVNTSKLALAHLQDIRPRL